MRLWVLVLALACAGVAGGQTVPCFRSKFANEMPLRVRRVRLLDSNQLPPRDKQTIVRELRRECDCWPCALSDEVGEQVREMYQWYGYYQAVARVDIHKHGLDSYSITAQVQEGPQYRLQDLAFSGLRAFPPERVRQLFPVQAGDIFDTRKIRQGIERMRRLYGTAGYINFTAVPQTTPDTARGLIGLRIDAEEGQVFRLGPLLLAGLEPRHGLGKKLLDTWRPHVGDIYNSDFVDRFLDENVNGLTPTRPQVSYLQDAKAGTVAVRLDFSAATP